MKQHIDQIFNDFHICTGMYIGLFDYSDHCLFRYPTISTLPFESANTRKAVHHTLSLLYTQKNASYVTAFYKDSEGFMKDVCFTACYVNPILGTNGVYVFGPYSINKESPYNLPYVPKVAVKHMVELLDSITSEQINGNTNSLSYQNYHINRIVSYLESHYQENLTTRGIAAQFNMSDSYLCRLFKSETGQTFTEFLNTSRVEKSKFLLQHGTQSLLEISQSVGFSSQSYFCRIFKKLSGITPKEYRSMKQTIPS